MPHGPAGRDIVSTKRTERGDAITVERSAQWPVWITAFDGEDTVGLGLSIRDAQWLMAALQVAIDGPSAHRERQTGPPQLKVLRGPTEPAPRRGPLGLVGRPRALREARTDDHRPETT